MFVFIQNPELREFFYKSMTFGIFCDIYIYEIKKRKGRKKSEVYNMCRPNHLQKNGNGHD